MSCKTNWATRAPQVLSHTVLLAVAFPKTNVPTWTLLRYSNSGTTHISNGAPTNWLLSARQQAFQRRRRRVCQAAKLTACDSTGMSGGDVRQSIPHLVGQQRCYNSCTYELG